MVSGGSFSFPSLFGPFDRKIVKRDSPSILQFESPPNWPDRGLCRPSFSLTPSEVVSFTCSKVDRFMSLWNLLWHLSCPLPGRACLWISIPSLLPFRNFGSLQAFCPTALFVPRGAEPFLLVIFQSPEVRRRSRPLVHSALRVPSCHSGRRLVG